MNLVDVVLFGHLETGAVRSSVVDLGYVRSRERYLDFRLPLGWVCLVLTSWVVVLRGVLLGDEGTDSSSGQVVHIGSR